MKLWLVAMLAASGCSSEPDPHTLVTCAAAGGATMCEVGCVKSVDLNRMCIAQTNPNGTAAACEQLSYMGIEGCCATVGSGSDLVERFFACQM